MTQPIRANYEQDWLFPPSLNELVPADHPARFIRDFVDALRLDELGFDTEAAEEGRPAYAADLLLKVWLYGYFCRIRSSRRLEEACRDNLGMLWLTGRHAPDHNTLWRFWNGHRNALRTMFRQSVRLAVECDLVGFVLQAVDGTKVQSQGSAHKVWSSAALKKQLKELDKAIDEILRETERLRSQESREQSRLPEALQDAERRRQLIQEKLSRMEQARSEYLLPADPEARMMKCERRLEMAYNAQAVTDGKAGIVVGEAVTTDASDNHQLTTMLTKTEEQTGQLAAVTVADAGYFSGEELAAAAAKNTQVLVQLKGTQADPARKQERFHSSNFTSDADHASCVCPRGQQLEYVGTHAKHDTVNHYPVRVFACRVFKGCPERAACCPNGRARRVELNPYRDAVAEQQARQQQSSAQAAMKQRMAIAERTNAQIKHHDAFRRWTVRGQAAIGTQWSLLCAALNLRIIWRARLQHPLPG